MKTFCTIKKIKQKNDLFKINKPEKTLQLSRYSTVKTLRREKHSRRLKIVREKLAMTSRIMGFHDVSVKFPWRHARHIYGCSRKYETIDPSKEPMRFPQFYLQYDNIRYFSSGKVIWSHIRCLDFIFPEPEARGIFNPDNIYETILPFGAEITYIVILQILYQTPFSKWRREGNFQLFDFLSNLKTFCTIKKITPNNGLSKMNKPEKTL